MEIIIIGIVTALNLIVLKMKFSKERYGDLALDIASIIVLNGFFGGTLNGMMIAMIASAIISTYLYFSPPDFSKWFGEDEPVEQTTKEQNLKPKSAKERLKDLNLT